MFDPGSKSDDDAPLVVGDGLNLGEQAFDMFKEEPAKRASADSA